MKNSRFTFFIFLLYISGFVFILFLVWRGLPYYSLPLDQRPYHGLHAVLKPGGLWGHGLGILGSAMILLLFLYTARKRELFGLRQGGIKHWLNVHILFGVFGPIIITLHTTMKFSGIVSISYFSMLAVMFSGVFGRYIYMQIPRDPTGNTLSLQNITLKEQSLTSELKQKFKLSSAMLRNIEFMSGAYMANTMVGVKSLFGVLLLDLTMPFRVRRLKKQIKEEDHQLPPEVLTEIVKVAKQKSQLLRNRSFLDSMNSIFHLWHVIHKPFAVVMVIIMFVHIIIAITFGYRWIF